MNYDFNNFKRQVAGAEEWLKKELQQIRTGQASPIILDSVKVEAYGSPMSMKEVASVTIEGARTLRIVPWDMTQVKAIEKAITVANLGVSVSTDDQGLRVSFPELTSDRRTQIAKLAKEKMEEAKKQLRGHRDEIMKHLTAKEKTGGYGKDDIFRFKNDLQKLVDESNKKLEEIFVKKEKEIIN